MELSKKIEKKELAYLKTKSKQELESIAKLSGDLLKKAKEKEEKILEAKKEAEKEEKKAEKKEIKLEKDEQKD